MIRIWRVRWLVVLALLLAAPLGAHADDPPLDALIAERDHVARMPVYSTATGVESLSGALGELGTWIPVDPGAVDIDALRTDQVEARGPWLIVVDPGDHAVVYATSAAARGPRVWRSADGGASWTSIVGTGTTALPDVPVHAIAVDPTDTARLYVASDVGVFVSRDTGDSWAAEHTGFGDAVTAWIGVAVVDGVPNVVAIVEDGTAWRVPTLALSAADAGVVLTVRRSGSGRGAVTSTPAGIACGTTCSHAFAPDTEVELHARPAADSVFVRWSGGCSGTARRCTVRLGDDTTVTATFRSAAVAITRVGSGAGRVTSSPPGIDCGSECRDRFRPGVSITLTAAPSARSVFGGWSGIAGCGRHPVCTFTPTASVSAVATFRSRLITVTKNGGGAGTVTSEPPGVDCGATCTGRFRPGATVTLTAAADGVSRFAGWGGACAPAGSATTCTVTMTRDRAVSAAFASNVAALTATKNGTGTGAITSSPAGIDCGAGCEADTAQFVRGTSVRLTAVPTAGTSHFGGWGGACAGTSLTCTVAMTATRSVTASFVRSAQVRFVNRTAYAGQSYIATLTTAQGYQWSSTTGTPSGYRAVSHAALSTLVVHIPGWAYSFAGSLTIAAGRTYRIEFFFASPTATQPSLGIECENCPGARTSEATPHALTPTRDSADDGLLRPAPAVR